MGKQLLYYRLEVTSIDLNRHLVRWRQGDVQFNKPLLTLNQVPAFGY
jgi:hypothetical protein